MCRRCPSMVLIYVVLLATGCGGPAPSTTLPVAGGVALDKVSQSTASAPSPSQDWIVLYGRWCAPVVLPPGGNGIARCEVTPILNDHFLSCVLTLTSEQRKGGMCLSFVVLQDASSGALQCWGLVSTGEHMTATLSKPNQRSWIWSFTSVRADGVRGTATHTWTIVDDNTWTWEVKDREWDNGTRSPGLFLTLKREREGNADSKAEPHNPKPTAETCVFDRGGTS